MIIPLARYEKMLGHEIAKRMGARRGDAVYQVASFTLPFFPLSVLKKILPQTLVQEDSPEGVTRWRFLSIKSIQEALGTLLEEGRSKGYWTQGASRGLKTASERYIRVLATLMPPLEISHLAEEDTVYVNMMYALTDHEGELHAPKDPTRREMALDLEEEMEIRHHAKLDLKEMGKQYFPLSPTYFRMIEMPVMAEILEAPRRRLRQTPGGTPRRTREEGGSAKPVHKKKAFEVERIITVRHTTGRAKLWCLVQWAHDSYEDWWEAYRISGNPGDPLVTWEPKCNVSQELIDQFLATERQRWQTDPQPSVAPTQAMPTQAEDAVPNAPS